MFASCSSTPIALAIVILGVIILGAKGTPGKPEEFRYVVGIFNNRSGGEIKPRSFLCAGTIISEYHVLTSGLCVHGFNANDLIVIGGVRDFFNGNVRTRAVEKLIQHPDTEVSHYCFECTRISKNNIGLIVLKRSIKPELVAGSLQQLKLVNQMVTNKPSYTVVIAGQEQRDSQEPWVLRKAEQPLVNLAQCEISTTPGYLPASGGKRFLKSDDQFLCAQHKTATICPDGSGSPLVNNGFIVGVSTVSLCTTGVAHIYANVYFHREWILQQTLPYLYKDIPSPVVARRTHDIDLNIEVSYPK